MLVATIGNRYRWRAQSGVPPTALSEGVRLQRYLSLLELQRIATLRRDGLGVRQIALELGRWPSTARTASPHDRNVKYRIEVALGVLVATAVIAIARGTVTGLETDRTTAPSTPTEWHDHRIAEGVPIACGLSPSPDAVRQAFLPQRPLGPTDDQGCTRDGPRSSRALRNSRCAI